MFLYPKTMDQSIEVSLLKESELEEADRIFRLAFGTFLGMPDPSAFIPGRQLIAPRFRSSHVVALAARDGDRLIGSNFVTRWGSFGFFGPLSVLPEFWDQGVAKLLLAATMNVFEEWGVRHTGLFTFPQSPKHVGLYQKFGYWPRYLTAVMYSKQEGSPTPGLLLSELDGDAREKAISKWAELSNGIDEGLDLTGEIRAALDQGIGDVVMTPDFDAFAICLTGPGSEGGEKVCYVKFGAARDREGFDRLLEACEAFAASHGATVEAGVNLAREDAYRAMRSRGYRVAFQGVAMHRPHAEGFNRPDVYVIDDWR